MTTAGTVPEEQHDEHASHGHEPPSYDDINTPVIVVVGVISAVITLLIILFVQGLAYNWQNRYLNNPDWVTKAAEMPANQQIAAQKAVLEGGNGIKSIEESMQKVVQDYGKK